MVRYTTNKAKNIMHFIGKAIALTNTTSLRGLLSKAKNLLLNPNVRVGEIAYEVGFQSLTHFNRVFKRILGQSPTEYRSKLPTTSTT